MRCPVWSGAATWRETPPRSSFAIAEPGGWSEPAECDMACWADIERLQRREAQIERPAVHTARIERQLANVRDLFAEADITARSTSGTSAP